MASHGYQGHRGHRRSIYAEQQDWRGNRPRPSHARPRPASGAAMIDLRYPIGKFAAPTAYTAEMRSGFIDDIEGTPRAMRNAVNGLSTKQLDTPYRPGGWTVRQVVHHVPDSHLNAYVRTKLALTEDEPT